MRAVATGLALIIGLLTAGCASNPIAGAHNTALDSVDLVQMTDDMALQLMGAAQVREAIARGGPLRVVVQPVENHMTGEVLPRGAAEAFTARLRSLLAQKSPQSFTWIMNRDDFYRVQSRELDLDLGPAPGRIQPEYALVARFHSLTNVTSQFRSAYYLCVYELTDLQGSTTLWTGRYEVKKTAVRGFLD